MERLSDYLPDLAKSGALLKTASSNPAEDFYVYDLTFNLDKSSFSPGCVSSFRIGYPGHRVTGGIRLTRDKCFWLFAHQSYSLPAGTDTQLLALRSTDYVLVMLPLSTDSYLGALRGPMHDHEHGAIFARFEQSRLAGDTGRVVVALARDINLAVKYAVQHARVVLGGSSSGPSPPALFADQLSYCTWNSLQPPTPNRISSALEALEHFISLGVRPASFLIDDGWQHVNSFRTLQSLGCAAPFLGEHKTLAEAVKIAKEKYGVRNVGVWHTIQGYWLGVDVKQFGDRYKLVKVTKDGYPGAPEPPEFQYYIVHPDSIGQFFQDYYTSLRQAGISFTKCDNMASLDHINSAIEVTFPNSKSEIKGMEVDIPAIRKAYINAIKAAAKNAFGAENVIWCMGMSPRLLLGGVGLGKDGLKRVLRNSDDYFPNEPDSHRYHIWTNVLNGLFLNNLDVTPDFDMFQTHAYISAQNIQSDTPASYAQAAFHASFRVFGTGPLTITDTPSKSTPEVLHKLVGAVEPGSTSPSLVIQASRAFTVSNDVFDGSVMADGMGKGLKIYVDRTIGVWNIRKGGGKAVVFVMPEDIAQALDLPKAAPLPRVILHIQSSSPASNGRTLLHGTTNPLHPAPPIRIDLDTLGWATIGVIPIENGTKVACLGLVDKYLSCRGVEREKTENGIYRVQVRCNGVLGIWIGLDVRVERVCWGEEEVDFEIEELVGGKRIAVLVKGQGEVSFKLVV